MEFTEEFFEAEIREGFEVPEMMKRAWAAQMEVLQIVIDICDRNGLQYFADWGTLLGAVRHQGFIPWDDDIDICLKREEFNQLLRILPQELPRGFALYGMWAETEELREGRIEHLRVITHEWDLGDYIRRFHGFPYQPIGIDIFQLDYVPRDAELEELQILIVNYGQFILDAWDVLTEHAELEEQIKKFEKLANVEIGMTKNTRNYMKKLIDNIASLYHENEADYMTNFEECRTNKYKLKKEWYDKVIMLPFENIQIAAPINYHEVLTALYGDYRIPVRGAGSHEYPFYGCLEADFKEQLKKEGFMGSVEEFCQAVLAGKVTVQTR